jgi:hypothetical protein
MLGLVWGAALYFRVSALWCIIPLAAIPPLMNRAMPRLHRLLGPIIAILLVFLSLTPWLIRNYSHFHSHFFRLSTLEGISLYEAVYPDADGGPKQHLIELPSDMKSLSEERRNDEWSYRAWQFIRDDPVRIFRLALVKIVRTWSPSFHADEFRNRPIQFAMIVWHVPLFILGLIGLCAGPLPRSIRMTLLVPLLYFTLVHALFLGSVRYRVPLMPLICILAAAGAAACWNRLANLHPANGSKSLDDQNL